MDPLHLRFATESRPLCNLQVFYDMLDENWFQWCIFHSQRRLGCMRGSPLHHPPSRCHRAPAEGPCGHGRASASLAITCATCLRMHAGTYAAWPWAWAWASRLAVGCVLNLLSPATWTHFCDATHLIGMLGIRDHRCQKKSVSKAGSILLVRMPLSTVPVAALVILGDNLCR